MSKVSSGNSADKNKIGNNEWINYSDKKNKNSPKKRDRNKIQNIKKIKSLEDCEDYYDDED